MPIRPQQHSLRHIKQPELPSTSPPCFLCNSQLLQLYHIHFQTIILQSSLIPPKRPRPHTIPALVPRPSLKMRQCIRSQKRHAGKIFSIVNCPKRRLESQPVAERP
ncbi:hypothetical protein CDL12_17499 [Handroanthus impetiginosus]|uniref:Uncharacterized protein n=1 Tax=Handroanthus impetiginosus TaxID=429701 RepID=A0A2G9GXB5_9LAMI|nr:hypothetical protein CDL12_17499 [Handroanthus impetiginosus]